MQDVPLVVGTVLCLCIPLIAQSANSYTRYEKRLAEQLERDKNYREQIAREQALIIEYKNKINESQKRIQTLKENKLAYLGVTQKDVLLCEQHIESYLNEISLFLSSDDTPFKNALSRLDTLKKEIAALPGKPIYRLPGLKKKLNLLLENVEKIKQREQILLSTMHNSTLESEDSMPERKIEKQIIQYTVKDGKSNKETLYNIANKVYGDPKRWPEIYKANKEMLDSNFKHFKSPEEHSSIIHPSDLLFPGQILVIPR